MEGLQWLCAWPHCKECELHLKTEVLQEDIFVLQVTRKGNAAPRHTVLVHHDTAIEAWSVAIEPCSVAIEACSVAIEAGSFTTVTIGHYTTLYYALPRVHKRYCTSAQPPIPTSLF